MTLSGLGILLASISAAGWATLDALRKRVGEDVSATAGVAAMTLFQLPFVLAAMAVGEAAGPFAEPWSSAFTGFPSLGADYWPPFLGSVALNVFANWLFFRAVQHSPLGLTIPYLSFTPVFTALTGFLILDQAPTALGLAGIFVVGFGAFLLNPGKGGPLAPLKALWHERGSLYMLLVAATWSVTPVLDKIAADRSNVMGHIALLAFALFLAFWVIGAVRDRDGTTMLKEFRAVPLLLVLSGAVTVTAMVLQLWAYHYMDVAYVETMKRAIGVVASILVGWRLFGEGELKRRLLAAVVMSLGVALVLIGG